MLTTITVDIGTTSVKLCLFDEGGGLVAESRQATPTVADAWGEVYDVSALRALCVGFIAGLSDELRGRIARVAFTGVGESGGLVRADLSLASPMILWHDHRGADRLARLSASDRSTIYRVTGLPANANYGMSKIAWAVDHAGDAADGAVWLNVAEFFAAELTGQRVSEFSLASRTLALDLETSTWSPEVCALFGVDPAVLPELRPAAEGANITRSAADALGLSESVRVHVAGHDHIVGAVGADLTRSELLNSTGTTEGILVLRESPLLDDRAERAKLANGLTPSADGFTLFASIPTGGSAFGTLRTLLGVDAEGLEAMIAEAHERYVSGSLDLSKVPIVLPQFRGSPPPTKHAWARGIIAGVSDTTTDVDLVFATFLGMVLQYQDVLDLFPEKPERIKVIGPASKNPLWLQLKADLLGAPLSVSGFAEVVSRGAQALASGQNLDWASTLPWDVLPDARRQIELAGWVQRVRPQWEHLKVMPA